MSTSTSTATTERPTTSPTPRPPQGVLGRSLDILDVVRLHGPGLSLAVLAERTGLPKPTVLRLARHLEERGLLDRRVDGYRLGLGLAVLGAGASDHQGYRRSAVPLLHALHAETGGLAALWTCSATSVEPLDWVGPASLSRDLRGRRLTPADVPALARGSVGRLVLAERPDLARWLRRAPVERTTRTAVVSVGLLLAAVARAAAAGVAVEHEQEAPGRSSAAVALRDRDGVLVGAVQVTGRTGAWSPERTVPRLLAAAAVVGPALRSSSRAG